MSYNSLEIVGTGSGGNCYLLTVGDQVLVIECGVVFSRIKKALLFDLSKVVGVLVTHEHNDHSCCFKDVLKFGKKIFCTNGTASALNITRFEKAEYLKPFELGLFKITPFQTFHDAKEPCGFLIEFEGNRMAFITDTSDLKVRLKNIDYWVIEANYSTSRLAKSDYEVRLKKRIQDTHLSIDRCKTILDSCEAEKSKLVLLVHASDTHSDKEEFLNKLPYASIGVDGLILELCQ